MGTIYYLYSMEFSKIISQNFLCSGVPVQVATVGIEALDVSTGTLYIQKKIPSGTSWSVKSKNYFQPSTNGIPDGDKGDINVTSSGTVWTIDDNAVIYAKMQQTADLSRLLGSSDASRAIQEIELGSGLTMTGNVLSASEGVSINKTMAYIAAY